MNIWVGPTVRHVCNIAMHVLHNFFGLSKKQQLATWADTALCPSTKERHGLSLAIHSLYRRKRANDERCNYY